MSRPPWVAAPRPWGAGPVHPRLLARGSGQPFSLAGGGRRLRRPCRPPAGQTIARHRLLSWRRSAAPEGPPGSQSLPRVDALSGVPRRGARAPAKGLTPALAVGAGSSQPAHPRGPYSARAVGGHSLTLSSLPRPGDSPTESIRLVAPVKLRGKPAPSQKQLRDAENASALGGMRCPAKSLRYAPGAAALGAACRRAIVTAVTPHSAFVLALGRLLTGADSGALVHFPLALFLS
jgi:hypothetical protein